MSKSLKQAGSGLIYLLPGLAGFLLFYILPFFYSLGYAFTDKPINGSFAGFDNFAALLSNPTYLKALKNTVIFIGICVPLNIVFSLGLALLINRLRKGKKMFALVFLIPLVIPSGATVYFWQSLFSNEGYLNGLITMLGGTPVDWLGSELARLVIIIIFIWKNLGYNMTLFIAGLNNIPSEYDEAASVEGASRLQILKSITLPCLMPTMFLTVIMSVINSFKVFKEIYMLTGSYPHDSIYMLQHYMNNMFSSLNYQKLTSAASILVLIIVFVTGLLLKTERRNVQ